MLPAMIHGFILSLGLILPLGAQNIFIFNQGVRSKRLIETFPAIISAALSDTLLIFLAVAGVSLLILSFPWLHTIFLAVGIIFLALIGWTIWKDSSIHETDPAQHLSAKKQILFALSVSLLNPHAILDTIGVIGTNALQYSGYEKWAFAAACAAVSWFWFFDLGLAGHLTKKITDGNTSFVLINRISALMIWGIAVYLGYTLFHTLYH
jgi:Lysine efflux permease